MRSYILGAALANSVLGLYDANSPVQLLDKGSFDKVKSSDGPWLVEFFASWCGHCKALKPEYEKAAKALKGVVGLAAVEDQSLMGEFGVQGFPTIKWFGENKSKPEEYNGGRTAKDIINFVMDNTKKAVLKRAGLKEDKPPAAAGGKKGNKAMEVTDSNFEAEVLAGDDPVFVKFYAPWCGHCKAMAGDYDKLAKKMKDTKVKIAKLDATVHKQMSSKYGIQGFPTLKLFVKKEGKSEKSIEDYSGGRTTDAMATWIENKTGAKGGDSGEKRKTEEASDVTVLTDDNFKELVFGVKDEAVFVKFYAPWCGHCKAMAPAWDKLASRFKGTKAKIAKLDATVHSKMASEYGVNGYPMLKLFKPNGGDDKAVIDYEGGRSENALAKWIKEQTGEEGTKPPVPEGEKPGDVVIMDDDNFEAELNKNPKEPVFVKFYAPWCGHCKAMEPTWKGFATKMKGKIKIAKVDATENSAVAAKYNVNGYPTLIMFPAGDKKVAEQPYDGGRDEGSLVTYASNFFKVEASQLLTQEMLNTECATTKKLCVIAFLPHLAEIEDVNKANEERAKYLDIYNEAAKTAASLPAVFLWSEGGSQFEFEEKLNLGFGFPAVVAIKFERKIFVTMKGAYTQANVRTFIAGLAAPKHLSSLPAKLPDIVKQKPWVRPAHLKPGQAAKITEQADKASGKARRADEDYDDL